MASPTGLTQLGDQLLRGSGDYANIQLRRQQEERQRAQQIADLQSQRAYQEQQAGVNVGRQKEFSTWQAKQQRIQELIDQGFLAQADAADDLKVAAADALAIKRTAGIRETGDVNRVNMQEAADAIGEQINQVYSSADGVQRKLAQIPQAPRRPDPREIEATAIQLAAAAGEDPKNDAVRLKYRPAAEKTLGDRAMQEFFIAQEAADALKVSLQGYNTQLTALTRRLDGFERNGIVPRIKPPPVNPAAALAPPTSAMRRASPDEAAAAAGGVPSATQTGAPSPTSTFTDPSLSPATSLRGLIQRTPSAQDIVASPGRAIDTLGRYGGAGLQGLWDGDYSVPQEGVVTAAGRGIGSMLAPELLPGDYMSADRAKALGLRRSLDLPLLSPSPSRTPASVFAFPDTMGARGY